MIDTLHIYLPNPTHQEYSRIGNRLDHAQIQQDFNAQLPPSVQGQLGNLKVTANPSKVSVKGSLSKFHLGDNLQRLTRKGTEEALEHLSEKLSLPLVLSFISRIDIGATMVMQHQPQEYFAVLGEAPRLDRSLFNGPHGPSVYHRNKQRIFISYDKRAEAMKKKQTLVPVLRGQNLLRLELKLTKRVPRQLGRERIQAGDLFEEEIWVSLLKNWYKQYRSIRKTPSIRFKENLTMTNSKDLVHQLAGLGLQQIGGEQAIVDLLKAERDCGRLDRQQFHRMKSKITELVSSSPLAIGTEEGRDLIDELDSKAKRVISNYR